MTSTKGDTFIAEGWGQKKKLVKKYWAERYFRLVGTELHYWKVDAVTKWRQKNFVPDVLYTPPRGVIDLSLYVCRSGVQINELVLEPFLPQANLMKEDIRFMPELLIHWSDALNSAGRQARADRPVPSVTDVLEILDIDFDVTTVNEIAGHWVLLRVPRIFLSNETLSDSLIFLVCERKLAPMSLTEIGQNLLADDVGDVLPLDTLMIITGSVVRRVKASDQWKRVPACDGGMNVMSSEICICVPCSDAAAQLHQGLMTCHKAREAREWGGVLTCQEAMDWYDTDKRFGEEFKHSTTKVFLHSLMQTVDPTLSLEVMEEQVLKGATPEMLAPMLDGLRCFLDDYTQPLYAAVTLQRRDVIDDIAEIGTFVSRLFEAILACPLSPDQTYACLSSALGLLEAMELYGGNLPKLRGLIVRHSLEIAVVNFNSRFVTVCHTLLRDLEKSLADHMRNRSEPRTHSGACVDFFNLLDLSQCGPEGNVFTLWAERRIVSFTMSTFQHTLYEWATGTWKAMSRFGNISRTESITRACECMVMIASDSLHFVEALSNAERRGVPLEVLTRLASRRSNAFNLLPRLKPPDRNRETPWCAPDYAPGSPLWDFSEELERWRFLCNHCIWCVVDLATKWSLNANKGKCTDMVLHTALDMVDGYEPWCFDEDLHRALKLGVVEVFDCESPQLPEARQDGGYVWKHVPSFATMKAPSMLPPLSEIRPDGDDVSSVGVICADGLVVRADVHVWPTGVQLGDEGLLRAADLESVGIIGPLSEHPSTLELRFKSGQHVAIMWDFPSQALTMCQQLRDRGAPSTAFPHFVLSHLSPPSAVSAVDDLEHKRTVMGDFAKQVSLSASLNTLPPRSPRGGQRKRFTASTIASLAANRATTAILSGPCDDYAPFPHSAPCVAFLSDAHLRERLHLNKQDKLRRKRKTTVLDMKMDAWIMKQKLHIKKIWRKRYVRLDPEKAAILYWKTEPSLGEEPRGVLPLSKCEKIQGLDDRIIELFFVDNETSAGNAIPLETSALVVDSVAKERTIVERFEFESKGIRGEWLLKLKQVLDAGDDDAQEAKDLEGFLQ